MSIVASVRAVSPKGHGAAQVPMIKNIRQYCQNGFGVKFSHFQNPKMEPCLVSVSRLAKTWSGLNE